ncbi:MULTISPECIES: AzlD domain-containing protein [unclassified Photobacterium]|uniref:AzlD domain-containing protein n=1 Tax=unclassified Photobacterium TaxID=2628852 RepID=UPI001B8BF6AE|nr:MULTISPECIES: AzlD domain-containing protein [unclassified Photobacterium]MDO6705081.1 AzlD domain-containing protein [Photobacterium sp. 1_MG-2023]QUJ66597.1 AzlD domain-containing protein [Photobacterium sp. GJ3]
MPEEKIILLTIILMAAVTYLPRVLPLHVPSKIWPKWLKDCIEFLPVSLISVITIPNMVVVDGSLSFSNPSFLAFIPTAIIAYTTRNLIVSVVSGVVCYMLIEHFLI